MRLYLILFLLCTQAIQSVIAHTLIPKEVLFGSPEIARFRISPHGTYFSYCMPVDNVLNVFIKKRETDEACQITHDTHRGVHSYWWRYDERALLYMQDKQGDENWHIYSVDLETGYSIDLTPYDDVQVRIVSYDERFPTKLIIMMNQRDRSHFDLYTLDLDSGLIDLLKENPGFCTHYLFDEQQQLRGYSLFDDSDGSEGIFLYQEDGSAKELIRWDIDDSMISGVGKFSQDGRFIYVFDGRGVDKTRLIKVDTQDGSTEIIFEDKDAEVTSAFFWPNTDDLWAVVLSKDTENLVILNDDYARHRAYLKSIAAGDPVIASLTLDLRYWVVCFIPDDASPRYYLYDSEAMQATYLCTVKPKLDEYQFSKTECISFPARDGLTLHGYLTYPITDSPQEKLPLVLLVHGGPWARDHRGFNSEVQLLTNRGYAVLQINFRGSTGYGKAFISAGDRQWGRAMQDDLTDAVVWAINQGIADPAKIAIMGASYGGYAALAGAAFTPDLYTCAIDSCGPSNLVTFLDSIPPYWRVYRMMNDKRIGNAQIDADDLIERSPFFSVDRIKIPMLIAQGAYDPRVVQAESDQIVTALQQRNIPVTYILFEDEGHGFAIPENRLHFYDEVELFLHKYLGGLCQLAHDANVI